MPRSNHHKRSRRPRPSKLALTLSFFFLSTFPSASSTTAVQRRDGWRPDTELPGAPFILGDGKNEGSKVKGYDGEWPLWSSLRTDSASPNPASNQGKGGLETIDATSPISGTPAGNATKYVCAPISDCNSCSKDVIHLPYCRPYNNRRRTACVPISQPSSPESIKAALSLASSAKDEDEAGGKKGAMLGWEACGKSARQEGRDYFEMIAVVASIALFSVWAFVQRQKLLFRRQNQMLQSRVTGQRRLPGVTVRLGQGGQRGIRKKRSARLGSRI
ncbi:uncharacterized protein UBRO_05801 [Ustilago bromivora]|uniref:Uncharacterized protein n=1 Tax=Ustilago bromivora TaxID=307758 RepID=A0A1K0G9R0_9BASI|nr:uncharacterized protein UBRO_05801 [Ustilago bromivora]SYW77944.1 uncharacterized protein UBRO2_02136 [Ustilago bromivora]